MVHSLIELARLDKKSKTTMVLLAFIFGALPCLEKCHNAQQHIEPTGYNAILVVADSALFTQLLYQIIDLFNNKA